MRYLVPLFYLSVFFLGCTLQKEKELKSDKRIIAYVNSWQDNWGKDLEKATQVTHINFAFANIKNGLVVEGKKSDTQTLRKLNSLKQVNPDLKILISVGGWSWSGGFSDAVLTSESREKFANSAIRFMLRHKIDGIDLDWEYPGLAGAGNIHRQEDKENFTAILKLLRKKLDSLSSKRDKYLLTIATGASQNYLDHTDMSKAQKFLDFINIMTYDFYTGGSNVAGHHANLYKSKYNNSTNNTSAQLAVNRHIDAGIPKNKIVLGVPFYGRWWKGVDPTNNGLYQAAKGQTGSYNYNAIIDSLNDKKGYTEYWDESANAPYIWRAKDSLFLSFENKKSTLNKVNYIKKRQLGGIMFWQFNGDNGELLETIFKNLLQKD